MQPFGLTKDVNKDYKNTRLKILKTNAAIWFNKRRKNQQLQNHQAKDIKNEYIHLV